jgi:hypothetical protein
METIDRAPPLTARDTADYVERVAKELSSIAAQSDLGFLAYLLSMVEQDAAATTRRLSDK